MASFEQAYTGRRLRQYLGAAAFVAGLAFVGVGSLSVVYDALGDGMGSHGAALWAATVTGVGLAALVAAVAEGVGGRPDRRWTAGGLAASFLGVALVWALAPPTWTGGVPLVLLSALLVYCTGLLALVGTFFAVATDDAGAAVTMPGVVGSQSVGSAGRQPAVGDGGNDDGLQFPLDDENER